MDNNSASGQQKSNTAVFKNATFGGFEKKSVLNYIYELNNSTKAAQDKLKVQIEELTGAREKLAQDVRYLEEKMKSMQTQQDSLTAELIGERERSGELNTLIDRLNTDLKKQEEIIAEKEQKISEKEQMVSDKERQIAEKEVEIQKYIALNRQLEEKNEEIKNNGGDLTHASTQIGELMIQTRLESERILENARRQAEHVVADATKNLSQVTVQFDQLRAQMAAIQRQIRIAVDTFEVKITEINGAVDDAEAILAGGGQPIASLTLVGEEEKNTVSNAPKDFFPAAAER